MPQKGHITSLPANSFGPGYELEGKFYRGKEIGSMSTRKHIVCKDGTKVLRKGARVEFNIEENIYPYRQVVKVIS
jgi:hypothetical protein